MTVSLAIALNALADVALLGGLSWLMSRPAKLPPHISSRHPGHLLSVVHEEAHEAELMREQREELIAA